MKQHPYNFLLANRTDGLGVRLMALLNAMALSEKLKIPFKFTWQDNKSENAFHTVQKSSEMFSEAFLKNHFLKDISIEKKITLGSILDKTDIGYYECPQSISGEIRQFSEIKEFLLKSKFIDYFNKISFSEKISTAIDAAKKIEIPSNSIALHLRAGDVIYGGFKRSGYYTYKVISFPIAEHIINSKESVVVFSQDEKIHEKLRTYNNVILSKDLCPKEFDNIQCAFFDILLMSKCAEIYGGRSGFSIVSSMLSKRKVIEPNSIFSPEFQVKTIENWIQKKDFGSLPKEQISYTYLSYLTLIRNHCNNEFFLENLKAAEQYDENNKFYCLLKIILFLETEKKDAADNEIKTLSDKHMKEFIDVIRMNFSSPSFLKYIDMQKLDNFISTEVDCASYYLLAGIIYFYKKNNERACFFAKKYYDKYNIKSAAVDNILKQVLS